ncbi:hypothetical protein P691DRAFT_511075 [Macrolepiota fuliginosa MF-IS2]|uniref:Uncharacterized protein n=1 Tax=Macrolepiota fuliginosa MF-IS2 TaxID=1400762 RepID=A0A9P5XGI9_9AGAR|nr:hypothetical protein P691DRAFT_511075 [Macrolepiota fuliginosa MF-IS2]
MLLLLVPPVSDAVSLSQAGEVECDARDLRSEALEVPRNARLLGNAIYSQNAKKMFVVVLPGGDDAYELGIIVARWQRHSGVVEAPTTLKHPRRVHNLSITSLYRFDAPT